ncbi:hypothetical protein BDP27DRAFT_1435481 [Rhodocollybia butyracea]|uniref:Uncharacterized protein n=1 Tax=Rhodocollybia butyracea TaxID=206335 RepID=A0A9P5P7A8_9AGAR|nr:hypothetical protein BDP27DRAFT_1435481 [Rhodocollybia butyracea]
MPASTVASQGGRVTAQAVAPKAPSKKEVDLKAFALRQKKEAQKEAQKMAQQAKDEVIRQCARAMCAAQCDDKEDDDDYDNATQVFDGLGDRDLDGHGHGQRRVPPLDEEEPGSEDDEDLDGPLDEDPDALLFNETFEGGSSDDEHRQGEHRSNDDDNDDDAVAVAAGDGGNDNMDVDVPLNHVSSPPSTPLKKASNRIRGRLGLSGSPASSRSRSSVLSDLLTPPSRCRGGKITEKHFTPNTRRLAILGKR